MILTAEQYEFFKTHGYLILKGVLDSELLSQADHIVEQWLVNMIDDWEGSGIDIDKSLLGGTPRNNFLTLWKDAGAIEFSRRPNKYLINDNMFELMNHPIFVSLAQKLLAQKDISLHGIFNARCQIPHDTKTATPIHQDSQYWLLDYGKGDQTHLAENYKLVTFWFPLHKVDEHNGAMRVISRTEFDSKLLQPYDYDYERTGYVGLSPQDISRFKINTITLERGDLLVFDHLVPHGACKNISSDVRWSLDIRYEQSCNRAAIGEKFGFDIVDYMSKENEKRAWIKKAIT